MVSTDDFKSQKEPFEFVLPSKDSLNGPEAFFEDLLTEEGLASSFGGFSVSFVRINIGGHPRIEYLLTVCSTIINTIKAYNGFSKKHPNRFG